MTEDKPGTVVDVLLVGNCIGESNSAVDMFELSRSTAVIHTGGQFTGPEVTTTAKLIEVLNKNHEQFNFESAATPQRRLPGI